jgi:hypothetical protein
MGGLAVGEIADHYIDKMLGFASKYNEISGARGRGYRKTPPERMVWTTAKGDVLLIDGMGNTHILNCLHLIEREHGYIGPLILNEAPTYRYMVDTLIKRKALTGEYLFLTISERLNTRIQGG